MKAEQVKRNKLNKLSHIPAAAVIILHGIDKLDTNHKASAIFFLIAGTIFFMIAIFHHQLVTRVRSVDAVFSFIEAVLATIISIDLFNDHKHYIQYAYLVAATVYFIRSFILFKRGNVH